ncbi:MAG: CDP-archaeol synthase [Desulfobacteraceae bacterium]|nr:CDP-archaeol synthase [Desulfobacteraceae bacterium]
MAVLAALLFLLWGNFLPPLSRMVFEEKFGAPLDGGRVWRDGQDLFGSHKTIRGALAILIGGTAVYPLLGVVWWRAATASLLIIGGDLLSSFLKRRLEFRSGAIIPGLDQIFEGLLPLAIIAPPLGLSLGEAGAVLALFVFIAFLGSLLWQFMMDRPAARRTQPRLVRSRRGYKRWRACHPPLARWQLWLNFENFVFYRGVVSWCFRLAGLYRRGAANSLEIRVERHELAFPDLPPGFDGFKILLLTDLHLDGLDGLTEVAVARLREIEADLCLFGGDLRMEIYGPVAPALRQLKRLVAEIQAPCGIFGVLGNHDCIEMVPDLEDAGLAMLVNAAHPVSRQGEALWLVGVDDPHYYRVHDPATAFRGVPPGAFAIFLAHSPEAYREAAAHGAALYLCGHTHGGQICTPSGIPLFTHSRAPRHLCAGRWRYQAMQGYTSRGLGPSGVPLRFNCPGEITIITLRRA